MNESEALKELFRWCAERRNAPDATTLGMVQTKITELESRLDAELAPGDAGLEALAQEITAGLRGSGLLPEIPEGHYHPDNPPSYIHSDNTIARLKVLPALRRAYNAGRARATPAAESVLEIAERALTRVAESKMYYSTGVVPKGEDRSVREQVDQALAAIRAERERMKGADDGPREID